MQKFLLAFLCVSLLLVSCKTTKEASGDSGTNVKTEKELKYEPLANALLWEITNDSIENPSYLYGTIHIIPSEDYFLPKGTLEAIGSSEKMVFEIDMKEMNNIAKQLGLLSKAFMKDGLTLKDLYTEEEYEIVKEHFRKIGLPIFFLERMKPMLLTVFASGDFDPSDLQSGAAKSYEMEFYDMAKDSKMETGGLETIEYQMSIFDSIPYTEQAEMLLETIELSDTESGGFQEMIDIYKLQDIEGMQTMFDEDDSIEGNEDILLIDRNKNWIPLIGEYMKEGTTFFAVGAGHLAGPDGVLHLLRKEGYRIRPVSNE